MSYPWTLNNPFTIAPVSAQQAADIEDHWRKVREGLSQPVSHVFADDSGKLIEMHRAIARTCIEGAAHHARIANRLAAGPASLEQENA